MKKGRHHLRDAAEERYKDFFKPGTSVTYSNGQTSSASGDIALHKRIRNDLEERILSGDWPPGHRIPYEHELMAQYGCARMTVNRAISALVQSGLVERRRRAGTFVAQPGMESAVLAIPNLPEEIRKRGKKYRYELRSRTGRTADAADAKTFQLDTGSQIVEIRSRHFADELPFVSETRIINVTAVPAAADTSFEATPPGSWLLDNVPWTEAEHNIYAITPTRQVAQELEIPRSMACLCLERRTWRNGLTVTFVRQVFRGDVYHLSARFAPGH